MISGCWKVQLCPWAALFGLESMEQKRVSCGWRVQKATRAPSTMAEKPVRWSIIAEDYQLPCAFRCLCSTSKRPNRPSITSDQRNSSLSAVHHGMTECCCRWSAKHQACFRDGRLRTVNVTRGPSRSQRHAQKRARNYSGAVLRRLNWVRYG